MSRTQSIISSSTTLGVSVTLLGVALLQISGGSLLRSWMALVVLLVGFIIMVVGVLQLPGPSMNVPAGEPGTRPYAQTWTSTAASRGGNESEQAELAELNESFLKWCDGLESHAEIWPSFDRWMRDALHSVLRARRVRNFHVLEGPRRLAPLTGVLEDPLWLAAPIRGLIEHVVQSGRRYLRGAPEVGELMQCLAGQLAGAEGVCHLPMPDWVVPVRQCGRTMGILAVGELPGARLKDVENLDALGQLLGLFWRHVQQWEELSLATRTDRASGLLNRIDLARQAEAALKESQRDGEPLVVLALSIEGLRRLDDQGLYELRNWLIQQVGLEMHRRLRSDDLIGRFSDDRFLAVLRRLDVGLGQIIARKLLDSVRKALYEKPIVDTTVKLRCGLAGAGEGCLDSALGRAFEALNVARGGDQDVVVAPSVLKSNLAIEVST